MQNHAGNAARQAFNETIDDAGKRAIMNKAFSATAAGMTGYAEVLQRAVGSRQDGHTYVLRVEWRSLEDMCREPCSIPPLTIVNHASLCPSERELVSHVIADGYDSTTNFIILQMCTNPHAEDAVMYNSKKNMQNHNIAKPALFEPIPHPTTTGGHAHSICDPEGGHLKMAVMDKAFSAGSAEEPAARTKRALP
jgi:hypothetical protein